MTKERLKELLNTEDVSIWQGCNVYQGLKIIAKYVDVTQIPIVISTKKDILYSIHIDRILETGITEEDVTKLRYLNWMVDSEHLACFT